MIDAWLGVVAVALLAAAYIVVGARRHGERGGSREDAATAFARRRDELQAEGRVQGLAPATVAALEEELALSTLDEAAAEPAAVRDRQHARPPLPHVLAGALAIAGCAVGLYALWGEPYAPVLAQASQLMQAAGAAGVEHDPKALEPLRAALEDRARRWPNDGDNWFFLAHLHMQASDHTGAARAFAALREITGPNEQIDVAWARASFLADGRVMSAATRDVVDRALAAHPNHHELLELLAMDALRQGEFLIGARYLARALDQPVSDSRRAVLAELLALTRTRLDPERPFIEATIHVVGQPPPWLMVFARPAGGGMPLAARRLPARETQTVVLDDATSMNDALPLSSGAKVEVVARLSETGDATAAGLEAISAAVDATTQPRIELTLAGKPSARRTVAVEVSTEEAFDAVVPIYVIAQDPSHPGPPVAVRRVFAGDLPARVVLGDADAMLPGRRLSDLDAVHVLARASIGGTPSAQSGDWESDAATVKPGADGATVLRINRRLP